jgi:secondary thiamine-phosphate synthase enzyme
MRQTTREISVRTHGPGLYEITSEISDWIDTHRAEEGLLTIFIRHTSASLTVQENADPDVLRDLDDHFRRLAPEDPSLYRHTAEGPDDMPAHIRSALTLTQLSIPIVGGRLALGTWQGVFVFEHRSGRFTRRLALHLLDQGRRK